MLDLKVIYQNEWYVNVRSKCPCCKNSKEFILSVDKWCKIAARKEKMQDILPELPAHDRERFISGLCPDCWEELFGGEEDEKEN